jgi:hypothetical protein
MHDFSQHTPLDYSVVIAKFIGRAAQKKIIGRDFTQTRCAKLNFSARAFPRYYCNQNLLGVTVGDPMLSNAHAHARFFPCQIVGVVNVQRCDGIDAKDLTTHSIYGMIESITVIVVSMFPLHKSFFFCSCCLSRPI